MSKLKKTPLLIPILLLGVAMLLHGMVRGRAERKRMFLDAVVRGNTSEVEELLAKDPGLAVMKDGKGKGGIGSPVLHAAIRHGHRNIVEVLLSRGANPSEKGIGGWNALHVAAQKGDAKVIELLIKDGMNVNSGGHDSSTYIPLCYARSRLAAEVLISNGADLSWRDKSGGTVLHTLVKTGTTGAMEAIIEHGVNVNAQNNYGKTALHVTAAHGRKEMAELLVAKGANINIEDNRGFTPLKGINATRVHGKDFAEFLIRNGAKYNINDVARLGDLARFKELLDSDPALVNYKNSVNREQVLFAAIYGGNTDIFKLLLVKGVKLDTRGTQMESSLFAASYAGNSDALTLLIGRGLDVNERGLHGESALHWAAVKGNNEAVRLLIAGGADITAKAEEPTTHLNAGAGNFPDTIERELIKLQRFEEQRQAKLAERSMQIVVPSRLAIAKGDTPLHSASLQGHSEIVKILLSNGAEVDAKNQFGQRPLHYACVFRQKEVAEILLDTGADSNAKDNEGHTPLGLAAFPKGNPAKEIVELLHARGGRK
ncbi:MAG: hypothetical protein FVQ84_20610 [Planctomycetes bacterium]|nr:hypothetical protein [Planctomycetota bacterium]